MFKIRFSVEVHVSERAIQMVMYLLVVLIRWHFGH